jgi:hypothetical protein
LIVVGRVPGHRLPAARQRLCVTNLSSFLLRPLRGDAPHEVDDLPGDRSRQGDPRLASVEKIEPRRNQVNETR